MFRFALPGARPERGSRLKLPPSLTIVAFTALSQAVAIVTQIYTASLFGSSPAMDAYVAASALPQYAVAVVVGAIGAVAVPSFTRAASGQDERAFGAMLGQLFSWMSAIGLALTAGGLAFGGLLLQVSAPGLGADIAREAQMLALLTWPSLLFLVLASFATGACQTAGRFLSIALAPVAAALAALGIMALTHYGLGSKSLALSTTVSSIVQVLVLGWSMRKLPGFRLSMFPIRPELRDLSMLFLPMVVCGVFARSMPLFERGFAAAFPQGVLSHVNYAGRITMLLSTVLASGLATVIFPRLAHWANESDHDGFVETASRGLRSMWMIVAPVTAIGCVLAQPLVGFVFRRGAFSDGDVLAVSSLLMCYLPALAGMTLGSISSRLIYSLRQTRVLTIASAIEAVAYVGYTALLVNWLGASGLAWATVVLFTTSLIWHLWFVQSYTKRRIPMASSMVRTAVCAGIAAGAAWLASQAVAGDLAKSLLGGIMGLFAYGVSMWAVSRREIQELRIPQVSGKAVISDGNAHLADSLTA